MAVSRCPPPGAGRAASATASRPACSPSTTAPGGGRVAAAGPTGTGLRRAAAADVRPGGRAVSTAIATTRPSRTTTSAVTPRRRPDSGPDRNSSRLRAASATSIDQQARLDEDRPPVAGRPELRERVQLLESAPDPGTGQEDNRDQSKPGEAAREREAQPSVARPESERERGQSPDPDRRGCHVRDVEDEREHSLSAVERVAGQRRQRQQRQRRHDPEPGEPRQRETDQAGDRNPDSDHHHPPEARVPPRPADVEQ